MLGMLSLAFEEVDNPLYYVLDELCSVMHVNAPSQNLVRYVNIFFRFIYARICKTSFSFSRSAVVNAGYQVSNSHCHKNSLKTNAPYHVIWDVLRKWCELNPIREHWRVPEHRVYYIMQKPIRTQVDFTLR